VAWKTIGVKEDVKKIVDEIAKRRGMKKYEVVELAIRQFMVEQKYKRGEKAYHWGYDIDKNLWYSFKLINSVAQLKTVIDLKMDEKVVEQFKRMTLNTISQIEDRLGVDLGNVRRAVEKFVERPAGKTKAKLNDETKVAMARILFQ